MSGQLIFCLLFFVPFQFALHNYFCHAFLDILILIHDSSGPDFGENKSQPPPMNTGLGFCFVPFLSDGFRKNHSLKPKALRPRITTADSESFGGAFSFPKNTVPLIKKYVLFPILF